MLPERKSARGETPAPHTDFVYSLNRDRPDTHVPPAMSAEYLATRNGTRFVRISGGIRGASSKGLTEGFSVRVPDAFESKASGQAVRIHICARTATPTKPTTFALAYSTNDVGNSGWKWFTAKKEWELFSFEYDVHQMVAGNGDYIAILPDWKMGSALDVSYVAGTVIDRTERGTAEALAQRPDQGYLFLGGLARSGTSSLWRVLAGIDEVCLGLERYVSLGRTPERFLPQLFAADRFFDIQSGDTFYTSFATAPAVSENWADRARYTQATIIGDKIPRLHPLFPAIERNFKGAKVVWIVRNIFDVAASFQKRADNPGDDNWPRTRDYKAACAEWNEALGALLKWANRLPIAVIDFESYASGQLDTDKLADFLDLPPNGVRASYLKEIAGNNRHRPSKDATLSSLQAQHIAANADVSSYRKVLELAKPWSFRGWPPHSRLPASGPKYQKEDAASVDYEYYEVAGHWARGPRPTVPGGKQIAFMGAASAFGRHVDMPYAQRVSASLGFQPLNLGYGGARAPLYSNNSELLALINQSRMAVIEVFSARGTGTSHIESRDHASAFLRLRGSTGEFVFADTFFRNMVQTYRSSDLDEIVADLRRQYVIETLELLERIRVPKILFWFSQRSPDASFDNTSADGFMGLFPHFVNRSMFQELIACCDLALETVTRSGSPEILRDRQTGEPLPDGSQPGGFAMNVYYPSQAMHDEAAEALAAEISKLS